MVKLICLLLFFSSTALFAQENLKPAKKLPKTCSLNCALLKASSNFLFPGVGQFILGNHRQGATEAGIFSASLLAYSDISSADDFIEYDDRFDKDKYLVLHNKTTADADTMNTIATNTFFYSFYSTYRDAQIGSSATKFNSFKQLAKAPINWNLFSDPYVWAPLGALMTISLFAKQPDEDQRIKNKNYRYQLTDNSQASDYYHNSIIDSVAIGIGEEVLFRGVINHYAINKYGYWGGLIGSSLLFGLAHMGDGFQASPLAASAAGFYFGHIHYNNNYDLQKTVALHTWWDGIVFLKNYSDSKKAQFAINIPF